MTSTRLFYRGKSFWDSETDLTTEAFSSVYYHHFPTKVAFNVGMILEAWPISYLRTKKEIYLTITILQSILTVTILKELNISCFG